MVRSSLLIVGASLLALSFLSGCPEDGSDPVASGLPCTPGNSICVGNYTALCATDGASWAYNPCGLSQVCKASGANAICSGGACPNRGGGVCLDATTLDFCPESGLGKSTISCKADEVCPVAGGDNGGTCVPSACTDGETRCGYRATLTCTGGAWVPSNCASGELCTMAGGTATCADQACAPLLAFCEGGAAQICNFEGTSSTSTACGADKSCVSGFCQPATGGAGDVIDATSGDGTAGDADAKPDVPDVFIPPLQKISKITFSIDGIPQEFDVNGGAIYVPGDQLFKISAAKGNRKLEINIAPVEATTVGQWTDTDLTGVVAQFCYFDGSDGKAPSPNCGGGNGFTHESLTYLVTVDKNNGPSSYVEGSFTASLSDALGAALNFEAGTFLVLHK